MRRNEWQKRMHRDAMREARMRDPKKFQLRGRLHYKKTVSDPVRRRELFDKNQARSKTKPYRDKINKARAIRRKLRRKSDPSWAMMERLRRRITIAIDGKVKSATTSDLIGCSHQHFMEYLESLFEPGMTWENRHLWHIDHIRPCASFDLTNPAQQRCCFHYSNLQPLWAKDNIVKSDKTDSAN